MSVFKSVVIYIIVLFMFSYSEDVNRENFLSVKDILNKVYTTYNKYNNYSVEFKINKGGTQKTGKIVFEKPDKYFIEYKNTGSNRNLIKMYLNKGILDIYLKDINVILEENLDKAKKEKIFDSAELNLFDINVLLKNYDFQFKDKKKSQSGLYHVYLSAKNKKDMLDDMELWVNKKGYIIKSLVYTDTQNLTFNFYNIKINDTLAPDLFNFQAPPSVEKINSKILNSYKDKLN